MTCIQQWWLAPQEVVAGDPLWSKVILLLRNETGLGVVDSGPLNLTLQTVGSPVINSDQGQWGNGSLLTSSGNYVRLPDDPRIAFPALGGLTIEVAYWQPGPNTSGTMFHFTDAIHSDTLLGLSIPTHNAVLFGGMGSGVTGTAGTAGSWHRLVMMWFQEAGVNYGQIFHDGRRIWTASAQTQPSGLNASYAWIGCGYNGTSAWPGRIGEFRITAAKRYEPYYTGSYWAIDAPTERMPAG